MAGIEGQMKAIVRVDLASLKLALLFTTRFYLALLHPIVVVPSNQESPATNQENNIKIINFQATT